MNAPQLTAVTLYLSNLQKCVAEVDWKPDVTDRHKSLEFHEVGKKGNVIKLEHS